MELTQTEFWEGELAEEDTWQTMVLVPKGKKEYRGIGLVEVTWKVVAAILHRRLTTAITYHDALHGFREGCGTGLSLESCPVITSRSRHHCRLIPELPH